MSSPAIAIAQEALNLNLTPTSVPNPTPVPATPNPQQTGEIVGKVVRHWSFYVMSGTAVLGGLVAVAGLITLIVGIILVNTTLFPVIVGAVVLGGSLLIALSNGVGAYYIDTFSKYKVLEDYIGLLAKKVKDTAQNISKLDKVNDQLKKTNQRLQATLDETQATLQTALRDFRIVNENLEKQNKDFVKATNALALKAKDIQVLHDQIVTLEAAKESYKQTVANFTEQNNLLKSNVDRTEAENVELKGSVANFTVQVQQLKASITELRALLKNPIKPHATDNSSLQQLEEQLTLLETSFNNLAGKKS